MTAFDGEQPCARFGAWGKPGSLEKLRVSDAEQMPEQTAGDGRRVHHSPRQKPLSGGCHNRATEFPRDAECAQAKLSNRPGFGDFDKDFGDSRIPSPACR